MNYRLITADVLDGLAMLPDGAVQCVVTSPPYWGLRDYGTATWEGGADDCDHVGVDSRTVSGGAGKQYTNAGSNRVFSGDCRCGAVRVDQQLGLERTPDEYVARMVGVFREVRRVLRDDGTLWLNIGDSYAAQRGGTQMPAETLAGGVGGKGDSAAHRGRSTTTLGGRQDESSPEFRTRPVAHRNASAFGLKHKDLVGIPWMLAKALRDPYYTGTIRDEGDRIWLAAMLDAEGCMFIHKRKAGQHNGQGYHRVNDSYGPGVEIANTSLAIVERVMALVGKGSICTQGPDETEGRRKQTIYRWNLRTIECRDFVREIYPYLVGKQQQARILIGCPSSGDIAEASHAALMSLHRTGTSSFDCSAPPSMFEPGWYLRSEIIWSKCNPMPESVTDRPTKAHEQLFLLSKSARYRYDADAIAEPSIDPESLRGYSRSIATDSIEDSGDEGYDGHRTRMGIMRLKTSGQSYPTRNRRSVWTIATAPFPEAHFATFPPDLVEPCILAGSRVGDTVLDPFSGSGTTGVVALSHQRDYVGVELNESYVAMSRRRLQAVAPLFATESETLLARPEPALDLDDSVLERRGA